MTDKLQSFPSEMGLSLILTRPTKIFIHQAPPFYTTWGSRYCIEGPLSEGWNFYELVSTSSASSAGDVLESSGEAYALSYLAVMPERSGLLGSDYVGLNIFTWGVVALVRWLDWGLVLVGTGLSWMPPLTWPYTCQC